MTRKPRQDALSQARRDLISAALRHIRDAEHLATPGPHTSPDQAWHLVGFAPECIYKACLSERWADKVLGHIVSHDHRLDLLTWIFTLEPTARRYAYPPIPSLDAWLPEARYQKTGTYSLSQVKMLVEDVRALTTSISADLWTDGVLPSLDGM